MAFLIWRSSIHASLTLATDLGMSRMLRSSPYTLEIGRTVGSTCSLIGTSLTVYFSRVVIFPIELVDGVEVVVVVVGGLSGGGVEDCARNSTERAQARQRAAGPIKATFVFIRCIVSLTFLRLLGFKAAYACSTSTTYQEPAWFPLFPVQLNPARMCAPTGGRVIRGYPVRGTYTTQSASPKAETQPMFPCPGCTKWLPSSNAGCSDPTRDRSPRSIWVPISMNSPSASIVVTLAVADCSSCAYSSTRSLRHPLAIGLRALAPKHKTTSCSGHCTQAATPLKYLLLAATEPPRFDELPVDVDGVIQVQ